jgi:exosortase/archaeosortase family protein
MKVPHDGGPKVRGRSARGYLLTRFCVTFLGILLVFSALYRLDEVVLQGRSAAVVTRVAAGTVAFGFRLLGRPVTCVGSTIYYGASAYRIIPECTGIEVVVLFAAAVVAFPSRWRERLVCLAWWVPGLLAINLVRIVTLMSLGERAPVAFTYGHEYVWPAIVLTVALGAWLSWADRVVGEPRLLD